jgi:hypothetical protein
MVPKFPRMEQNFHAAEDNPNGLNKYKDSPTQLANKLPGTNKSFTKKKHSV